MKHKNKIFCPSNLNLRFLLKVAPDWLCKHLATISIVPIIRWKQQHSQIQWRIELQWSCAVATLNFGFLVSKTWFGPCLSTVKCGRLTGYLSASWRFHKALWDSSLPLNPGFEHTPLLITSMLRGVSSVRMLVSSMLLSLACVPHVVW